MADFKISKGYEVPIEGAAAETVNAIKAPAFLGISPNAFPGLKPKLCVAVNDEVKVGSPLFFNKKMPDMMFVSPAGGRVTAINYGPRRVIEEIVISRDDNEAFESFQTFSASDLAKQKRETLIAHLLKSGAWPFVRQRPFDSFANPEDEPKALFINCMDTAPLANNPDFSLKDKGDAFKAGVEAMKVLAKKVVITTSTNPADIFTGHSGVEHHRFSGKHPAGLLSTHITKIDPINKGDVIWHVHARDLVLIGELLLSGKVATERLIALAGPSVKTPGYASVRIGSKVKDILAGNLADGEQRFISGNVLSGDNVGAEGYLGFYSDLITVLPEGREQHFIGWMLPGFNVPSFTRTFVSGLFGGKKFKMNTNLNGGHRAIIQSGMWERVVALDIHPEFLVKATMAEDIDAMERLGILECAPEDFALCTYICPSKTEVSDIIAKGLELMEKEG